MIRWTKERITTICGLVSGLLFVASTTAYANVSTIAEAAIGIPGEAIAKSVVTVAEKSGLLACVYILAIVTCACMLLAWKQFATVSELSKNLGSLVTELNNRPCIFDNEPRQGQNQKPL